MPCPAFISATPDAHILYSKATVLLSTNVGFLAWSDNGRAGEINSPTAAQIMTYISIICSVGSIIVGLTIFKQYRAKGADTPLRAVMPIAIDLATPLTSFAGRGVETYPKRVIRSGKARHHM